MLELSDDLLSWRTFQPCQLWRDLVPLSFAEWRTFAPVVAQICPHCRTRLYYVGAHFADCAIVPKLAVVRINPMNS